MMAPNNIFSPSSGRPIITPTQDITLGCFYLTAEPRTPPPANPSAVEALRLEDRSRFRLQPTARSTTHERIRLAESRLRQEDRVRRCQQEGHRDHGRPRDLQRDLAGRNSASSTSRSRRASSATSSGRCYKVCGHDKTVDMLDKLKELGFREATQAGVSIGIDDMIIPKEKDRRSRPPRSRSTRSRSSIARASSPTASATTRSSTSGRTAPTRSPTSCCKTLEHNQGKKEYNPVSLMVDSGARGNQQQVRQLAGVRGLMAKPSGDIIEKPDSLQLPRGPHRARILHLDPRRPQGSGRHRAQDRRLRLHDPQAGAMWRRTSSSARTIAAPPTASGCRPSTKAKTRSSSSASASSAAARATTSRIR